MIERMRARLTFANVVSLVALFFALGGSAYAAYVVNSNGDVAPNTISGHAPPTGDHANVIAGSVTTQDLATGSINQGKLGTGAVSSGKLGTDAVTGPKVKGDSLTGSDINESTLGGIGTGILGGQWDNLVHTAGSVQRSPVGHTTGPSSVRWLAPVEMVITDLRVKITVPPGAGNARGFGIVGEDAQNNNIGSLDCDISGATATTCHSSGKLTIPAGGLFDGEEGASGNINSSGLAWFGYRVLTP
jgi:hypothetical protein